MAEARSEMELHAAALAGYLTGEVLGGEVQDEERRITPLDVFEALASLGLKLSLDDDHTSRDTYYDILRDTARGWGA